ncbi:hypothetical protein [Flavihumibacter sp.]|uniref:hypothetical protein n=1 Tax=Flavihumibacter sp. TaxID=1913981 RepID=UPI002FC7A19F
MRVKRYFPKTNRHQNNSNHKKPILSTRQQKLLYSITIIGTIASTLLAGFSIYLTHKIAQTSTKVEKMDSLIALIAVQNLKQNEQLSKLQDIQKISIEFSQKLSEQIISIKDQTSFLQDSYSPDISLGKIDFSKSNIKEGENILSYQFNNIGGRALKDLHSKLLVFLPTVKVKDSIYYLMTFEPTIFDGNTTDLKPNSSNFHYATIPSNKFLDSIFKISSMAIMAEYVDPLTNEKSIKTFYYKNFKGLDNRLLSIYAPPKEARIMSTFLDTAKIIKASFKRDKKNIRY